MQPGRELDVWLTERLLGKCPHTLHAYTKDNRDPTADYTTYRCRKCRETFSGLAYHEGGILALDLSTTSRGMGLVIEAMNGNGFKWFATQNDPDDPWDGHEWCAMFSDGNRHYGYWDDIFGAVALAAYNALSGTAEGEK